MFYIYVYKLLYFYVKFQGGFIHFTLINTFIFGNHMASLICLLFTHILYYDSNCNQYIYNYERSLAGTNNSLIVNSFINIHYCNLNIFSLLIDGGMHYHLEAYFGIVVERVVAVAVVVDVVEVDSGLSGASTKGWIVYLGY